MSDSPADVPGNRPQAWSTGAVFAIASLGIVLFGVVLSVLGAMLPDIASRFDVSKAAAGSLLMLLSFAILLGSLLFGPSVDRLGYRAPLTAAAVLVTAGIEAIAFAPSLAVVRAGVVLIGLGGGIFNVACNAVVADTTETGKAARLNLLGAFFGIGAVGVPFAIGSLQRTASLTAVVASSGAFAALTAVATARTGFPIPKQPHSFPIRQALRLAREEMLLLIGLMAFLESGMEITVGGWISTFAGEALLLSGRGALFFLALYWLGMMAARVVLGTLLKRLPLRLVIGESLALAFVGVLLLLLSRTTAPAAIGVFVVGAGFAGVFPTLLSWLGERYRGLSGTAFSIALVMALAGGMVLPYLTGVLGERFGMRTSLTIVPVALVCSASLFAVLLVRRLIPASSPPETASR